MGKTIGISMRKKKTYRKRYSQHVPIQSGSDGSAPQVKTRLFATLTLTTIWQEKFARTFLATPSLPYDRLGVLHDPTAHIRWTSNNFLHSGSWESHRDNFFFDNINLFSFFNYSILITRPII